jgi:hypothetical protein
MKLCNPQKKNPLGKEEFYHVRKNMQNKQLWIQTSKLSKKVYLENEILEHISHICNKILKKYIF